MEISHGKYVLGISIKLHISQCHFPPNCLKLPFINFQNTFRFEEYIYIHTYLLRLYSFTVFIYLKSRIQGEKKDSLKISCTRYKRGEVKLGLSHELGNLNRATKRVTGPQVLHSSSAASQHRHWQEVRQEAGEGLDLQHSVMGCPAPKKSSTGHHKAHP